MLKRVLSNTWTTVGLLTLIIRASSYLVWLPTSKSVSADNTIGEIIYLTGDKVLDVPLLPNNLNVQTTTNWSTIEASANAGLLDAVIIHRDAQDEVNVESLRYLFRRNEIVVVGMGIADEHLHSHQST